MIGYGRKSSQGFSLVRKENMKKLMFAIAGLIVCSVSAAEWRPSDALLRAVQQVESSGGIWVYGDSGRSLGAFQMSEGAWADVNAWRRSRGLKVYSYSGNVMNPYLNRTYASNYLSMIHGELSRKMRRNPTAGEIYAAYNMGLKNFEECNYRLAEVNPVTARKVVEIHQMIAKNG